MRGWKCMAGLITSNVTKKKEEEKENQVFSITEGEINETCRILRWSYSLYRFKLLDQV